MNEENKKSNSALREEKILEFWKENKIFEKSLEKDSPKGEYVFYEGPPTANGKPGIHHLEARAFKDAIPRYKTMCGYHVRRKGGWDTHGLPVELQVEKKLGLDSKKAIEDYGIAKFNKECKASVWEYTDLWEKFTDRIGYWVDQKNAYVTYRNDYIESVWNIIKTVNDKKLLYKDYKVVPWCPRCGTTLSSHELAQGYLDVKDLSVYAKFKVVGQENTYILAWTTTPWTLPGNVALAVGEDIDYVKIKLVESSSDASAQVLGRGGREPGPDHSHKHTDSVFYVIAKARLSVIESEYEIVEEMKGKDLVGLEYEPLYPYLKETISDSEKPKLEKAFKVYTADFVTTEDGAGVVHTAVMYGQDDFVLGNEIGLPKHHLVGLDGKYLSGTGILEGRFVRDEETAVEIIKDLAHRGLLFKKEKYEHSYPHCWRCKTALIYYARDSWYIKMSQLRDLMVAENKGINWEPSYIKEGRFGEWLSDIKDWAISRERYWGTPLPVWTCDKCGKIEVLGSIEDIKSKTKKSGNKYFVMRHGEADNNVIDDFNYNNDDEANLTDKGKSQILNSIKEFKEKVDIVISSPFNRTRQTSEMICKQIGFSVNEVIYDERIKEWKVSSLFNGKSKETFLNYYQKEFTKNPFEVLEGGESFVDLIKRIGDFIYDLENKYKDKNIFIVSHGGASRALDFVIKGLTFEYLKNNPNYDYLKNAEIKELNFAKLPHDENYELDLHRPYIDEVELVCDCGGKLERSKEVMDVWLDSGTMPFSQDHYPFENTDWVDNKGYPADFISEAIDQTRGWFYTLHAVGAIMGKGKAYKNVVCLGHILDANGKKMSKSLGNIVDPWEMIYKYGADTLRLWMYSVNQPGESKNFDEKTVSELHNKIFNLLYNVLAFYELYRDEKIEISNEKVASKNILDQWIISKLGELIKVVTNGLDNYKLLEPVRATRDFVDDLSTWYLRRSRERIKDGNVEAKGTLYFILKNLAKIMAPFAPFTSEDIWQKLKNDQDKESVHLEEWPNIEIEEGSIYYVIQAMEEIRNVVTFTLQQRQKSNIPVRQPLKNLFIKNSIIPNVLKYADYTVFLDIIMEEVNVKGIQINKDIEEDIKLDTEITPELKLEGQYRELVRAVQDMRKKMGLNPNDVVSISIETSVNGQEIINKWKNEFMKSVGIKEIKIEENDGEEIKISDLLFTINLVK